MTNDKMFELLLEELRLLRVEIKDLRSDLYGELEKSNKDISALKTRFMIVAISMGLAGGKLSSLLPFLK